MAKTFDDYAADGPKIALATLEALWGRDDAKMAKKLKCSVRTVAAIRTDPLSVTAVYTERLRRYVELEAQKKEKDSIEHIRRYL